MVEIHRPIWQCFLAWGWLPFALSETFAANIVIVNPTNYEVQFAVGMIKDTTIAGIGDQGSDDPNPFIRSRGWWRIAPRSEWRQSLKDDQFEYDYILVRASSNGRRVDLPLWVASGGNLSELSDPEPFAVGDDEFKLTVRRRRLENDQVAVIQQALLEPARFFRVPQQGTVVVCASPQSRAQLDAFMRVPPPPGESLVFVTNNAPHQRAFELTVVTRSGQIHTFPEWKSIGPGETANWQLASQLGEVVAENTKDGPRLMIGLKIMMPDRPSVTVGFDQNGQVVGLAQFAQDYQDRNSKRHQVVAAGIGE